MTETLLDFCNSSTQRMSNKEMDLLKNFLKNPSKKEWKVISSIELSLTSTTMERVWVTSKKSQTEIDYFESHGYPCSFSIYRLIRQVILTHNLARRDYEEYRRKLEEKVLNGGLLT